ncbi:MAG: 30S ribosomal protein S16 [Candidatus Zixiibacteriota bacterium]
MAVHIRLRRMGKKKRPYYRIVAADSRRARDGRFLEVLGTYNPIERPAVVSVKEERLTYWLNTGAEPSDTVSSLLTQIGFTEKYHKVRAGQDVAELALKATITERKKKTRKAKKAAAARAQAAEAEAAAAAQPPAEGEKTEG